MQRAVAKEFKELIRSTLRRKPTDHLHLVWYCVHSESKRLGDYEVDLIRTLSEQVPTVFVLTQCLGAEIRANEFGRLERSSMTKSWTSLTAVR